MTTLAPAGTIHSSMAMRHLLGRVRRAAQVAGREVLVAQELGDDALGGGQGVVEGGGGLVAAGHGDAPPVAGRGNVPRIVRSRPPAGAVPRAAPHVRPSEYSRRAAPLAAVLRPSHGSM